MLDLKAICLAAVAALIPLGATADCAFKNETPVSLLSPGFAAWKAMAAAMEECGNFTATLDQEYANKIAPALEAQPALYSIAGLTVNTFDSLMSAGLLRPLDDLIATYAPDLPERRLNKVNGETYAIAAMVNLQHLIYRTDILDELGLEVPTTYEEVLAAAEAIAAADLVEYPLGGTYKPGFDLGLEFINLFLAYGGSLTDADNQPSIEGEAGLKTLEMMKRLSAYMDPEYLSSDSTYVQQQFQQGKIAMANLWASRADAMFDKSESMVADVIAMAAAPKVSEDSLPATTSWWGGFGIAANVDDATAEAAFRVAIEGSDRDMVTTPGNNDLNIWLIDGFVPGPSARGVEQTLAQGKIPLYPASTAISLMHTALGNGVADFLIGRKTAEQTLSDISEAYRVAAKEKGLLPN